MELDDFKPEWQALNQKLDQQTALNLHLLRESRAEKLRHGLRPLVWGQAIQIVLGTLLALSSGSFWTNHFQVPHLLLAGLLMHAYGLAMIIFGARLQVLIHRIDFGAPVLSLQKQMAELRRFRIVSGLWLGLPWWLLWIPFTMMVFGSVGFDIFRHLPRFVIYNAGAGIIGLVLIFLFLRWAKSRPELVRTLEEEAGGNSLKKAQRVLDEIARFEHPDS